MHRFSTAHKRHSPPIFRCEVGDNEYMYFSLSSVVAQLQLEPLVIMPNPRPEDNKMEHGHTPSRRLSLLCSLIIRKSFQSAYPFPAVNVMD